MNKKRIVSLVLSLLVILPTTAYAKGNDYGKMADKVGKVIENKNTTKAEDTKKDEAKTKVDNKDAAKSKGEEKKAENEQKKEDKKQQIEAFKTAMKAKHEEMKQIQAETKKVKQEVEQKKEQLSAIINDLQSGKKTLPEDQLNALLAAAQNLKVDAEEVKATAEISTEVNDTQAKVKGQDFNNALASMDKVITKLQKRLEALKQLSADLDKALEIGNLATVPAPTTDTTQNSSTGTTTTPQDGTQSGTASTQDSTAADQTKTN
jgi:chromosome segregation ATPase